MNKSRSRLSGNNKPPFAHSPGSLIHQYRPPKVIFRKQLENV